MPNIQVYFHVPNHPELHKVMIEFKVKDLIDLFRDL